MTTAEYMSFVNDYERYPDLHDLFRNILTRDSAHTDDLVLCIEWILFSRTPLNPQEFYFATRSGLNMAPASLIGWDPQSITVDDIHRFVRSSSKGLVEVTRSKDPKNRRVQFIHESVNDFFLRRNGLTSIRPHLETNLRGVSHEQLKERCLLHVNAGIALDLPSRREIDDGPRSRELIRLGVYEDASLIAQNTFKGSYPFLEYATRNVLYHADQAAKEGIEQTDFLAKFPREDWIDIGNLVEKHKIRKHTSEASLLYILAEENLPHLIDAHPSKLPYLTVEKERYGTPLFAAFAMKGEEAIHAFLRAEVEATNSVKLQELYRMYCELEYQEWRMGKSFQFQDDRGVFSYLPELGDDGIVFAFLSETDKINRSIDIRKTNLLLSAVQTGHNAIARLILDSGMIDPNLQDPKGRTAIANAARKGDTPMVKLLLSDPLVNPNVKDECGQTALSWAFLYRHEAVADILVSHNGVDINTSDMYGRTPLLLACTNFSSVGPLCIGEVENPKRALPESEDIFLSLRLVKLLLGKENINLNPTDAKQRTPLGWASRLGLVAIVCLLLVQPGICIKTQDNRGFSPISWAVRANEEMIIVMLLLGVEFDINAKDHEGRTPLFMATEFGSEEIVSLILKCNGVNADAKDIHGRTPLMQAASSGRREVVRLLSEREDVDVNARDRKGRTPLSHAVVYHNYRGDDDLLLTADDYGLPSEPNYEKHSKDVIEILLQTNCDVFAADRRGRTPLQYALRARYHEGVDLIRSHIRKNPICTD